MHFTVFHISSQKGVENLFVCLGKQKSTCLLHISAASALPVGNGKFCIIPEIERIPAGGGKNRVWITQANPQVSVGISQFRLWLHGRNRPVVRYTVLVKISCCTGVGMVGFSRMHNKIRFSTILLPLLLLLLLYSLNYTIYLYTNSIYRGRERWMGRQGR